MCSRSAVAAISIVPCHAGLSATAAGGRSSTHVTPYCAASVRNVATSPVARLATIRSRAATRGREIDIGVGEAVVDGDDLGAGRRHHDRAIAIGGEDDVARADAIAQELEGAALPALPGTFSASASSAVKSARNGYCRTAGTSSRTQMTDGDRRTPAGGARDRPPSRRHRLPRPLPDPRAGRRRRAPLSRPSGRTGSGTTARCSAARCRRPVRAEPQEAVGEEQHAGRHPGQHQQPRRRDASGGATGWSSPMQRERHRNGQVDDDQARQSAAEKFVGKRRRHGVLDPQSVVPRDDHHERRADDDRDRRHDREPHDAAFQRLAPARRRAGSRSRHAARRATRRHRQFIPPRISAGPV